MNAETLARAGLVSAALGNGRKIRAFTLVDYFLRECPSSRAKSPCRASAWYACGPAGLGRLPTSIRCDNVPEVVRQVMDRLAPCERRVLDFIDPGMPTQNTFAEIFNGQLRDECLNER